MHLFHTCVSTAVADGGGGARGPIAPEFLTKEVLLQTILAHPSLVSYNLQVATCIIATVVHEVEYLQRYLCW